MPSCVYTVLQKRYIQSSVRLHAIKYDVLLSCTKHTILFSISSISIIMIIIILAVFICLTMIMTTYDVLFSKCSDVGKIHCMGLDKMEPGELSLEIFYPNAHSYSYLKSTHV